MKELEILLALGKKGALEKSVTITTSGLGKELTISQQTVSRLLMKLTKKGLITRVKGIRSYIVNITPKGRSLLRDLDLALDEIFRRTEVIIMRGKVVDGLKDGKYYLSLSEYKKAIKKKLGFEPYPGTLNILINDSDRKMKERLKRINGINIEGFKKGGKIFGSIKCFDCRIDGIKAKVIIPERSHYGSDIIEIISPFQLRKKMKLENGDEVTVRIENENL